MGVTMNIALILSGGTGSRIASDIPKQYIEVGGKPIIAYAMECLAAHPMIDAVQIVADRMWHELILENMENLQKEKASVNLAAKWKGFSEPGVNRQLSIWNGLQDIRKYAADSAHVLIHDAARPLLPGQLVTECLTAIQGHDGVLPVLPMKDTVYFSEDGRKVDSLLKRSCIYAGQAPEVFRLGCYYDANSRLLPDAILRINGSTEPAIMAGLDVAMIPGDEKNFKITTNADLDRFRENMKTELHWNGH